MSEESAAVWDAPCVAVTCDWCGRCAAVPKHEEPPMVVFRGQREERRLHEKFAHLRLHGEWFRPDTELVDWIRRRANGDRPAD